MQYFDRIKETTTTTGTGDITLAGAASSFQTFATRYAVGDLIPYCIVLGTEWETGVGTLSDTTTFVRTTVHYSSNSDALVNFSAGSKEIFTTIAALLASKYPTRGNCDMPFALQ